MEKNAIKALITIILVAIIFFTYNYYQSRPDPKITNFVDSIRAQRTFETKNENLKESKPKKSEIEKRIDSTLNYQYRSEESNSSKSIVTNSKWDGSVSQVAKYLKTNLNDPHSYESIQWSKVIDTNNEYIVAHQYRAKNRFGAFIVVKQIFHISKKGEIIKIDDCN